MKQQTTKRLSVHQRRVLAALLALDERHEWAWWSRYAIGAIVGAGGFHGTIQLKTMAVLKEAGLVQTEFSSWPEHIRRRVRCSCCCSTWGLTDEGREAARRLNVHWDAATLTRVGQAEYWDHGRFDMRRDEDEPPPGWDRFDDDDDNDDGPPACPAPTGSPIEVLA